MPVSHLKSGQNQHRINVFLRSTALERVLAAFLIASATSLSIRPAEAQSAQEAFDTKIPEATQAGENQTVNIDIGDTYGNISLGSNVSLPGAADSINLNFFNNSGASAFFYVNGDRTLTIEDGADISFNGQSRFNVGDGAGETGTVDMTGGTLSLGKEGSYSALNVGWTGTGVFNQSGGTVSLDGSAFQIGIIGGDGTYNLSGGSIEFTPGSTVYIGNGEDGEGTLSITGDGQITTEAGIQLFIGTDNGTGRIIQDGEDSLVSINAGGNAFFFGSKDGADPAGIGYYELHAGTFEYAGTQGIRFGQDEGGEGHFIQSGGSFEASGGRTVIGNAGLGTYELSAGTSVLNSGLTIASGATSTGTVTQTGGSLTVENGLQFGAGEGSYELAGGTLTVDGITGNNSNPADFIFSGGTLVASDDFTATNFLTSFETGTLSTIDTDGNDIAWNSVVSGDGDLLKTGDGTLTLGAANPDFDGDVEISEGILALTDAEALGVENSLFIDTTGTFDIQNVTSPASSEQLVAVGAIEGSGTVELGNNWLVASVTGTATFSGDIVSAGDSWDSDYGRFIKAGNGTLIINDASMTGGEFHVADGTLELSGGQTEIDYLAVGTGSGSEADMLITGGRLDIGVSLQVGDWGGTGQVVHTGGQVWVEENCGDAGHCSSFNIGNQGGEGTYTISGTGELHLVGGSHSIGRSANSNPAGSGILNIEEGGLVILSPAEDDAFGRGLLVIGDRDGVSGAQTENASGTINQNGGTLRIEAGSDLNLAGYGHGTYNLNGGILEIGGGSLKGAYGGTGTYDFNLGNATLRVIGSDLDTSVDATLLADATFTFDTNGFNADWNGEIAVDGSGSLSKIGEGDLFIAALQAGSDPALNDLLIEEGDVSIGTGFAINRNLDVAAGSTLDVTGDFTLAPGATYTVGLEGTESAEIVVSGVADIDGSNLFLDMSGGYLLDTEYQIVSAADVNGEFVVTNDFAFLEVVPDYTATSVVVSITQGEAFSSVAETRNQTNTADAIEELGSGNPLYDQILTMNEADALFAFDLLSGEVLASAKGVLMGETHFLRDAIFDRFSMADLPTASSGMVTAPLSYADPGRSSAADVPFPGGPATVSPATAWAQGFGSWGSTDGNGDAAGVDRDTGGFLIGADTVVAGGWRVGLLGGYSHTSFDVDDRASSGNSDNYHLGAYAGTNWGAFGLRAGAAYSWSDVDTTRTALGEKLKADYDAGAAQVFGEVNYGIETSPVRFEPFAGLAYVNLHTDSFTETGGAAALSSSSDDTDVTFTTLGVRASSKFAAGGVPVIARGMLGWQHAFGDTTPTSSFSFEGGTPFTIAGLPIAEDALVVDVGVDVAVSANATLGLAYSGQFGDDSEDQKVRGSFGLHF